MSSAERVQNDKNCQMLYTYDINALTSPNGFDLTNEGAGLEGWYSSNPRVRVMSALMRTLDGMAAEVKRETPISFFVYKDGEHYVTLPYSVIICKVEAFIKSPAGFKFLSEQQKELLKSRLRAVNEPYRLMCFKQLTLPEGDVDPKKAYRLARVSEYVREWGMRIASPAPLCPSQKDLYATRSLQRVQAEINSDKISLDYPNTWTLALITSGWVKWYEERYPKAQIPVII